MGYCSCLKLFLNFVFGSLEGVFSFDEKYCCMANKLNFYKRSTTTYIRIELHRKCSEYDDKCRKIFKELMFALYIQFHISMI